MTPPPRMSSSSAASSGSTSVGSSCWDRRPTPDGRGPSARMPGSSSMSVERSACDPDLAAHQLAVHDVERPLHHAPQVGQPGLDLDALGAHRPDVVDGHEPRDRRGSRCPAGGRRRSWLASGASAQPWPTLSSGRTGTPSVPIGACLVDATRAALSQEAPQQRHPDAGRPAAASRPAAGPGPGPSAAGSSSVATSWPSGNSAAASPPNTSAEARPNGGTANTPRAKATTRAATMPAIGPSMGVAAPRCRPGSRRGRRRTSAAPATRPRRSRGGG